MDIPGNSSILSAKHICEKQEEIMAIGSDHTNTGVIIVIRQAVLDDVTDIMNIIRKPSLKCIPTAIINGMKAILRRRTL
jgi:hypothetical protein